MVRGGKGGGGAGSWLTGDAGRRAGSCSTDRPGVASAARICVVPSGDLFRSV